MPLVYISATKYNIWWKNTYSLNTVVEWFSISYTRICKKKKKGIQFFIAIAICLTNLVLLLTASVQIFAWRKEDWLVVDGWSIGEYWGECSTKKKWYVSVWRDVDIACFVAVKLAVAVECLFLFARSHSINFITLKLFFLLFRRGRDANLFT